MRSVDRSVLSHAWDWRYLSRRATGHACPFYVVAVASAAAAIDFFDATAMHRVLRRRDAHYAVVLTRPNSSQSEAHTILRNPDSFFAGVLNVIVLRSVAGNGSVFHVERRTFCPVAARSRFVVQIGAPAADLFDPRPDISCLLFRVVTFPVDPIITYNAGKAGNDAYGGIEVKCIQLESLQMYIMLQPTILRAMAQRLGFAYAISRPSDDDRWGREVSPDNHTGMNT